QVCAASEAGNARRDGRAGSFPRGLEARRALPAAPKRAYDAGRMRRRPLFPLAFIPCVALACGPEPQAVTPVPTATPSAAPTAAPTTAPSASAAPTAAAALKTETLAADTPMRTVSGASFTAPKGWHVTTMADGDLILEEPAKELRI